MTESCKGVPDPITNLIYWSVLCDLTDVTLADQDAYLIVCWYRKGHLYLGPFCLYQRSSDRKCLVIAYRHSYVALP